MYDTSLEKHLRDLFEAYFPSVLIFPDPTGQYNPSGTNFDNLRTMNLSF